MNQPQEFLMKAVKVRRLFERNYEKEFAGRGITALQALMLQVISTSEGIKATELSKRMGYNKSLVTKNIKDLSKSGYIDITPVDGRTICITISEPGRKILDESNEFGRKFVDMIFSDCNEKEKECFYNVMNKLIIE